MNQKIIEEALQRLIEEWSHRSEVLAIYLFGSWGEENFGVGSDIDLLLVLSKSDKPFLERIPEYLPEKFPIDVDVFPYTLQEIKSGHSFACAALSQGRIIWKRSGVDLNF